MGCNFHNKSVVSITSIMTNGAILDDLTIASFLDHSQTHMMRQAETNLATLKAPLR
jgi:hypothetical protein